MQAYYYYGIVLQDLNDAIQAQDYYLKAYKLGFDLERDTFLGRICANLGTLYTYQKLYNQASSFQQKAVYYLVKSRDTLRLSVVFKDIARIHKDGCRLDSAVINYTKALECASDSYKFGLFNELAGTYERIGDYAKGLSYAYKAYDRAETTEDSCLVGLALGSLYLKMGEKDSAYHYLSFCRRSTPTVNLVYDKQKKKIYNSIVFNADFDEREENLSVCTLNEEIALAISLDALSLIEEKGKLKGKLKEIATHLGEEDNPVIMLGKIKNIL